jgi:hypothetical protein
MTYQGPAGSVQDRVSPAPDALTGTEFESGERSRGKGRPAGEPDSQTATLRWLPTVRLPQVKGFFCGDADAVDLRSNLIRGAHAQKE